LTAQIKGFATPSPSRRDHQAGVRSTSAKADGRRPAYIYEEGLKPGVIDPDFSIRWKTGLDQDQMIALASS